MKKLIPPFLKRIDAYLLLNHPIAWISKIHIVLFYGLITWSLSALSGFVIPINLSQTQDLGLWYFLFTILAIIALCFWIYHNVIFNLEKKFGKRHWTDEYKIFFLNVACVFIFISFPVPFTSIYNSRVASVVSNEEFIRDINTLNAGELFVVNNINNYEATYDTASRLTYYNINKPVSFDPYTPWLMKYDTLLYKNLKSSFITEYNYKHTRSGEEQIRNLIRTYIQVWKKYGIEEKYITISEDSLIKRWKYLLANSPMESSNFYSLHRGYFNTYEMERVFNRIAEAKHRSLFIYEEGFLNFLLYTCVYLSLLVMMFKMVPWKQFLLTIIAIIIIPILLFIISQLLPRFDSSRDTTYLILMVLTLLVAIIFTGIGFVPARQFNPFYNICSQITYLFLPMLPVIILLLIKMIFFNSYPYDYNETAEMAVYDLDHQPGPARANYYNTWPYIYQQLLNEYWRAWFQKWIFISLYGGLVLFVAVLMPFMKHLFVRQLALPRRS